MMMDGFSDTAGAIMLVRYTCSLFVMLFCAVLCDNETRVGSQAKLRRVSWSSAVVDNHPPLSQPWLGDALSIAEADVQKLERRVAFESIVVEQLQVTPNVCCRPRFRFCASSLRGRGAPQASVDAHAASGLEDDCGAWRGEQLRKETERLAALAANLAEKRALRENLAAAAPR